MRIHCESPLMVRKASLGNSLSGQGLTRLIRAIGLNNAQSRKRVRGARMGLDAKASLQLPSSTRNYFFTDLVTIKKRFMRSQIILDEGCLTC